MQTMQQGFQHFFKTISVRVRSIIQHDPDPLQRLSVTIRQMGYLWSEFDINDFVAWLSGVRQRRIVLLPYPTPATVDGLWLTSDTTEFIIYSNRLTGVHRDHVILHEIGHFFLGHETLNIDEVGSIDDILSDPPEDSVAMRKFALVPLSKEAEIEAETFAILVLGRIADENIGIVSDGLKHLREEFH